MNTTHQDQLHIHLANVLVDIYVAAAIAHNTYGVDRAQKFDYAFSKLNSTLDIFRQWARVHGIKTSRFDKTIRSIEGFTFGAYVMNCIRATKNNHYIQPMELRSVLIHMINQESSKSYARL